MLTFWSNALAILKQDIGAHEIDQVVPFMAESVLGRPAMGGIYLNVLDCLRTVLVDLLGGVMEFKIAVLWELALSNFNSTHELECCWGRRSAKRFCGFKQIRSSDVEV